MSLVHAAHQRPQEPSEGCCRLLFFAAAAAAAAVAAVAATAPTPAITNTVSTTTRCRPWRRRRWPTRTVAIYRRIRLRRRQQRGCLCPGAHDKQAEPWQLNVAANGGSRSKILRRWRVCTEYLHEAEGGVGDGRRTYDTQELALKQMRSAGGRQHGGCDSSESGLKARVGALPNQRTN